MASVVGAHGRSIDWYWPGSLPAPVVDGNQLVYRDAFPDGDLVIVVGPDGFSHSVVLRERPDANVSVRLRIVGDGTDVRKTDDGGLEIAALGETVVKSPVAMMWDSAEDSTPRELSTTISKRDDGAVLALGADLAYLRNPKTVYPVTIDPTYTVGSSAYATYEETRVERDGALDPYLTVNDTARSAVFFPTAQLLGNPTSATLMAQSSSCTVGEIRIRRITDGWGGYPFPYWDDISTTASGQAMNGCASATVDTWDATAIVQAWIAGQANDGLEFSTDSGSRIYSTAVTLSMTSASLVAPDTPTDVDASSGGAITAVVSNPNGGLVRAAIQVTQEGQSIWAGTSSPVASGQVASVAIPATFLQDDRAYDVSVTAVNSDSIQSVTAAITSFVYVAPLTAPTTPASMAVGPRDEAAGVVSKTPTLRVSVSDVNSAETVTVHFYLQTATGSTVWSGTSSVIGGGLAYVTVPSSAGLQVNTSYRWYASAEDSSGLTSANSGFSTFQTVAISTAVLDAINSAAIYVLPTQNPGLILADGLLDRTVWRNAQAAISACMAAKGFTYGPMPYPLKNHTTPSAETGYGAAETGSAPNPVPEITTTSFLSTATYSQQNAYFAALKGDTATRNAIATDGATGKTGIGTSADTGGCESMVRALVVQPAVATWPTGQDELVAALDTIESSSGFISATTAWKGCMAATGYTYADYRDPAVAMQGLVDAGTYTGTQALGIETAVAGADIACRQSSGLATFFADEEPEMAEAALGDVESPNGSQTLPEAVSGANATSD
jgi:hypothetical protein